MTEAQKVGNKGLQAAERTHVSPKLLIEQKHAISRRLFSEEEDEKLLELYKRYPKQWSKIAYELSERSPAAVFNRYKSLTSKDVFYGPYQAHEIQALKDLVAKYGENDWVAIANEMPRKRDPLLLRRTWKEALDPQHKRGPWTKNEDNLLMAAIPKYHLEGNRVDWDAVAQDVGTRNRKQCYERFMYQLNPSHTKGPYTAKEDAAIITAVSKYGDQNWQKIKEVTGINRNTRSIFAHYKYYLDPSIDRSPWTDKETAQLIELFRKHGRMTTVKEMMNSNRSLKHMWAQYHVNRHGIRERRKEATPIKKSEKVPLPRTEEDLQRDNL
ncbi:unnamed protein product [Umbelopsis sp. WA50703]